MWTNERRKNGGIIVENCEDAPIKINKIDERIENDEKKRKICKNGEEDVWEMNDFDFIFDYDNDFIRKFLA